MRQDCLALAVCVLVLSYASAAVAAAPGPAVGTLAPDFKAHNVVTGENLPLSSQRGKVVILTFWASWCGPCRRELPYLERAQEVVGKDHLAVFAVSFKENPQALNALRKLASDWRINVIEDRSGWIASRYKITSIPHLYIIGRDGRILATHLGYGDRTVDELISDINAALSAPESVEPEVSTPAAN